MSLPSAMERVCLSCGGDIIVKDERWLCTNACFSFRIVPKRSVTVEDVQRLVEELTKPSTPPDPLDELRIMALRAEAVDRLAREVEGGKGECSGSV